MNPHISIPRQHGGTSNFGGTTTPGARKEGLRMPRFFKRLFKFPQMDFEMAIWEMTSLLIAPKKVFRSIYYHVRQALLFPPFFASCCVWCMLTSLRFRNVSFSPSPALSHGLSNSRRSAAAALTDLNKIKRKILTDL